MRPRRRLIGWVLVLALLLGSGWLVLLNRDDEPTYAEVTVGRIEQVIETTGAFRATDTELVRGDASGTVASVAVRPGDQIVAGDIVATLDQTGLMRSVVQARGALEDAELVAVAARSRARSGDAADIAEALLAAARVEAARQGLMETEAALDSAVIVATASGAVLDVPITAGAPYSAGTVAVVIAGDLLELTATLDQADLPLLDVGATVRVIPDALPEVELAGWIAEIAPQGEQQGGAVRFPITISLARQPAQDIGLRIGMTARLIVPSVSVEEAILIPAAAVETVGQRSFVRVLREGVEVTVEVSLGLRQSGLVQIAAGELVVGERVRISP